MKAATQEKKLITPVPEDQKYTLHGKLEGDFAKHLLQVNWEGHGRYKLITKEKDRMNFGYSEEMKSVGYDLANTKIIQKIMKDENDPTQSFFIKCGKATRLKNVEVVINMQSPGNITPWHQDHFISYRERHNCSMSNENLYGLYKRYWMPLEDWKSGHFFQSNNTVHVKWKAGELYAGKGDTPHLAATAGLEPRYFAQITGMIDGDDYLGKDEFETVTIE